MTQEILILKKRMQRIENFQISSLMNSRVSVHSLRRLQRCKMNMDKRVGFIEANLPSEIKSFSLKSLIKSVFPSAYYIVGR